MKLVIVESPAKAKTISKILGKEFVVESSIGHIRDLPKSAAEIPEKYKAEKWSRLGVNINKDFEPIYVVNSDKKKQVKKLKDLLKKATELYLATDEDREGESISWHLTEILKPKIPTFRLAFHEITKDAILKALKNPREINQELVEAQETRRILDRLYGYEVSPILWRKVAPKLSAGRVQSVALRVLVDRERERLNFVAADFSSVTGTFEFEKTKFEALLAEKNNKKIVVAKDFDPNTGKLKGKNKFHLKSEDEKPTLEELKTLEYKVESIDEKPSTVYPKPPFTTSTLQQAANSRLNMGAKKAMMVAQKLYENGYITYMRTDSVTLSDEALKAARDYVDKKFGADYLPNKEIVYKGKVKNAQEAHEAIRPTGSSWREPVALKAKLTDEEYKLYQLIFNRSVASQMKPALYEVSNVTITGGDYRFAVNGRVEKFAGFTKAYGSEASKEVILPNISVGDILNAKKFDFKNQVSKPPNRYSEASLVKTLEAKGIGRPSTYASIIDTILKKYVMKDGKALVPSFLAMAVVQLMEKHFTKLVDYEFTALMEEDLDEISHGKETSKKYLKGFYFGGKEFEGLSNQLNQEIDAKEVCTVNMPYGKQVRVGKFGPYIENEGETYSIDPNLCPSEVTEEKFVEFLKNAKQVDTQDALAMDPVTGLPIYKKMGRFGPYVQLSDDAKTGKLKGIPKCWSFDDLTVEQAQFLVSLPKDLGEGIILDLGRYGAYLKSSQGNVSIDEEILIELDLNTAKKLIEASPNKRGSAVVKEFEGSKIQIKKGRYGEYITDGKVNVKFPKGKKAEDLTLQECEELIKSKKK